jgi:hypothetical protein
MKFYAWWRLAIQIWVWKEEFESKIYIETNNMWKYVNSMALITDEFITLSHNMNLLHWATTN